MSLPSSAQRTLISLRNVSLAVLSNLYGSVFAILWEWKMIMVGAVGHCIIKMSKFAAANKFFINLLFFRAHWICWQFANVNYSDWNWVAEDLQAPHSTTLNVSTFNVIKIEKNILMGTSYRDIRGKRYLLPCELIFLICCSDWSSEIILGIRCNHRNNFSIIAEEAIECVFVDASIFIQSGDLFIGKKSCSQKSRSSACNESIAVSRKKIYLFRI